VAYSIIIYYVGIEQAYLPLLIFMGVRRHDDFSALIAICMYSGGAQLVLFGTYWAIALNYIRFWIQYESCCRDSIIGGVMDLQRLFLVQVGNWPLSGLFAVALFLMALVPIISTPYNGAIKPTSKNVKSKWRNYAGIQKRDGKSFFL